MVKRNYIAMDINYSLYDDDYLCENCLNLGDLPPTKEQWSTTHFVKKSSKYFHYDFDNKNIVKVFLQNSNGKILPICFAILGTLAIVGSFVVLLTFIIW